MENDVSIPEDPTGKKNFMPSKREREEALEKKAPSVQTTQYVGAQESSTKPSTYAWRKNSPIKENEKSPKKDASKQEEPSAQEEFPRNESPVK